MQIVVESDQNSVFYGKVRNLADYRENQLDSWKITRNYEDCFVVWIVKLRPSACSLKVRNTQLKPSLECFRIDYF